jgi:transposase
MIRFKQPKLDPKQVILFPTCLDDAIAADADVRVLSEVMDSLDWSDMEQSYSGNGCPAYPPNVLTKILVYAYSKGVRSSRKVEELVCNDKRYVWLAGGLAPDHNTIARFRKDKHEQFTGLFADSVRLCCEAGLVMLSSVSVDSTKIAAAASKKSLYDTRRLSKELEAVEKILREADEVDTAEDEKYGDGGADQMPDDLKDPVKRHEKLAKIAKRLKEEKCKSVSASDPQAHVMKVSGRLRPAYSMQAVVDSQSQVIVAMKLTDSASDAGKLPEMIKEMEAKVGLSADVALADTGYCDEVTFKWLDENAQDAIVVVKNHPGEDRKNLFSSSCFLAADDADELICPAGRRLRFNGERHCGSGTYRCYGATGCQSCSFHEKCVGKRKGSRRVSVSSVHELRKRMRERLKSVEGKELFSQRRQTVEPVFGQAKSDRGFNRFMLWGKSGASSEAALICLVHNMLKCAKGKSLGLLWAFGKIVEALSAYLNAAVAWKLSSCKCTQIICERF